MKLIFRILLLISTEQIMAQEIIVISYHPAAKSIFHRVREIITHKILPDDSLITSIQEEKKLTPIPEAIMQIRIQSNGIITFPVYKKQIIQQTFRNLL